MQRPFEYNESCSDEEGCNVLYDLQKATPAVTGKRPLPYLMRQADLAPQDISYCPASRRNHPTYMMNYQPQPLSSIYRDTPQSESILLARNPERQQLHHDQYTSNNDPPQLTSLLDSIIQPEGYIERWSTSFVKMLSSPQRIVCVFMALIISFYLWPFASLVVFAAILYILYGGMRSDETSSRTVKWTVTSLSQQMKDGFLASPAFVDKFGQWRVVMKQKRGMDGPQTSFGLICTDIFSEVEMVTASVTVFCTNQQGQEVNTGGIRSLTIEYTYERSGDCGFTRPIRISRRMLGDHEVLTINSTIEFKANCSSFLSQLAKILGNFNMNGIRLDKKGKNMVAEQGSIFPGELEFRDDILLPMEYRPALRFLQHPETKTFVWEIPAFITLMENTEVWGLYSPQFFVNYQDVCTVWRMKLLEVKGVFRLHVQLRGLSKPVEQVKLWYLLQMVDRQGKSAIPEHAGSRLKYPDHMNLWQTTRHILYKRETIIEKFIRDNGEFSLRISLQIQPNDVSLLEVDSDDWICRPNVGNPELQNHNQQQFGMGRAQPMISN